MISEGTPNTSGQGNDAAIPPEIRRWNWGAAVFGSIWALANGLTSNRETFERIGRDAGGNAFLFYLLFYLRLGSRGNDLAWKYRHWSSVEAFQKAQRRWSIAALVLLFLFGGLALFILGAALVALLKG